MQNDSLNTQDLTATLVNDLIKEKRAERRWKNIRFFLIFFLIIGAFLLIFKQSSSVVTTSNDEKGYVALIRLNGMIGSGEDFSAETVLPLLKSAFTDDEAKGVVLEINSGGGSPVQASIIHDSILELKKKYHKQVIVVGEDLLASGAYYVSVAADKIYVNPNSLTGSIGVIMKGFGFPDVLKKLGVERRVYTSGANKDRLDPFLPQSSEDTNKIRQVIDEVHDNFNQVVLEGRKGKLKASPKELFTGDFWSGQTALKLGLIDGLGNLNDVIHDEFHAAGYKDYSQSGSLVKSIMGKVGTSLNMLFNESSEVKVLEKI